jgi:DNA-binding transcriptional LysR family regulator
MDPQSLSVDLGEIVVFTRVVQGGSLTAAALALGMPKSTVSRKLAELEARVGARLLQRTTRSAHLTDIGRVYYAHCLRIVGEIEEAQLAVAQLRSTPRGVLRITVPVALAMLGPVVAEYLALYPDVQVDMVATDRRVDLVEERFDLALRAGGSPDSSLVARRLGVIRRRLVAAPKLAATLKRMEDPGQLGAQPCIVFAPEGQTWHLRSGAKSTAVDIRPRLVVNDYELLRSVARAGFGVALLPEHLCAEDLESGALVPVMSSWSAPEVPIFALYPSTRQLAPAVVAFLELPSMRRVFQADAKG